MTVAPGAGGAYPAVGASASSPSAASIPSAASSPSASIPAAASSPSASTPAARASLALVRRARRIDRALAVRYPDARCELEFTSPFELLVATVLSAQTTDVRVNSVTPELFRRAPTPAALAALDREELEAILRPVGFFRAKAAAVQSLSQQLLTQHRGEVPRRLEQLVTLPGVGRKTANVVRGDAFGLPGITVDTHVGRLSRRFGWTTHDDPVRVEEDLAAIFPRRDWTPMSHRTIFHGRRTCFARRPACGACPVARDCPSYGLGETDPAKAAEMVKGPPGA